MSGGTETHRAETRARDVLAEVAGAVRADLRPLAARVDAAVLAAVPALSADPDVRTALERSTEANLADVLALLAEPALPVDAGVPPEAVTLATTLVRRGVDPGDLVHAYLVGQNELWRAWMYELTDRLGSSTALIPALELSSARIFTRADFLVAQLMRHVDRERVRLMGGALARRANVVRELLEGDESDAAEASRALGYDVDRWVLAAVLWDATPQEEAGARHAALESQAACIARATDTARAFTVGAGRVDASGPGSATPRAPDLDRVAERAARTSLHAGAGRRARAPGRRGHGGLPLGPRGGAPGHAAWPSSATRAGVVRYDEVEAISLLSGRPRRGSDASSSRTLGPLTARRRGHRAAARDAAGLARRRAATRAARPSALHAHKNTVLYRLRRAQQMLGRPLDEGRGDLELALRTMRTLGSRARPPAA